MCPHEHCAIVEGASVSELSKEKPYVVIPFGMHAFTGDPTPVIVPLGTLSRTVKNTTFVLFMYI